VLSVHVALRFVTVVELEPAAMGRARKNPVWDYAVAHVAENRSQCNICKKQIRGVHSGNMEAHINSTHPDIAKELKVKKEQLAGASSTSVMGASSSTASSGLPVKRSSTTTNLSDQDAPGSKRSTQLQQATLPFFASKSKLPTAEELKDACVEMTTVNGRPFQILNDSGFRRLLDPLIAHAQAVAKKKITINDKNHKKRVQDKAATVRAKMTEKLKNRMICVKVDAATRMGRSILGVNAQFIEHGKVIVFTLAMKEMFSRHTAENLRDYVLGVLDRYRVQLKQVYSLTVDNGANMVRCGRLLDLEQSSAPENPAAEAPSTAILTVDDDDGESPGAPSSDSELDDEEDEVLHAASLTEVEELTSAAEGLELEVADAVGTSITVVRCAAHTLQLVVKDALKLQQDVLAKIRELTRQQKRSTVISTIRALKKPLPILDNLTRWSSTHRMAERAIELREFSEQFAELIGTRYLLSDEEWERAKLLVQILEVPRTATTIFQKQQLVFGDFLLEWTRMTIRIEELCQKHPEDNAAHPLLVSLKERTKSLLDNNVFAAAAFVDPRVNFLLDEDQQAGAVSQLMKIFVSLEEFRSKTAGESVSSSLAGVTAAAPVVSGIGMDNRILEESIDDPSVEELDPLEAFLRAKAPTQGPATSSEWSHKYQETKDAILSFPKMGRISRKMNILDYWEAKKESAVYSVAVVALSAPPTQVTVERCFSGLKFVLSDLRSRLSSDLLDDILLLRFNWKV
jgi:hypothetical protein